MHKLADAAPTVDLMQVIGGGLPGARFVADVRVSARLQRQRRSIAERVRHDRTVIT